jgi:hypothetical protein
MQSTRSNHTTIEAVRIETCRFATDFSSDLVQKVEKMDCYPSGEEEVVGHSLSNLVNNTSRHQESEHVLQIYLDRDTDACQCNSEKNCSRSRDTYVDGRLGAHLISFIHCLKDGRDIGSSMDMVIKIRSF